MDTSKSAKTKEEQPEKRRDVLGIVLMSAASICLIFALSLAFGLNPLAIAGNTNEEIASRDLNEQDTQRDTNQGKASGVTASDGEKDGNATKDTSPASGTAPETKAPTTPSASEGSGATAPGSSTPSAAGAGSNAGSGSSAPSGTSSGSASGSGSGSASQGSGGGANSGTWHPAWDEWIVTKPASTIHHEAVYQEIWVNPVQHVGNICNTCGIEIIGPPIEHVKPTGHGGHHTAIVTDVPGYIDYQLVSAAWDESVAEQGYWKHHEGYWS
jgi:hypothetical protein